MTLIDERIDGFVAEIADAAGALNLANARLVEITERVLLDETWSVAASIRRASG